jgi:alkylation response protein AidB-like acyl-CoA dehydrogenase
VPPEPFAGTGTCSHRTIFPSRTTNSAAAFWPGPSHLCCGRCPSTNVARARSPLTVMRMIFPAHGSAALNAIASWGEETRALSGPCTILAFGAKSCAAAVLWFAFSAALQARTIAAGEGGGAATMRKEYDYASSVDFELSAEQREIQDLARAFAAREIEPHAAAWDREHRFPQDVFAKLAEVGLMGVCVPEEYGGAGADFLSYVLVLEELSRADAGIGVTVAVHTSAATLPLLAFGTEEQRARFVPPLARGEVLGAFALTEPEAGSDAGAIRTRAERDGDGWRISGAKQWITNARYAGTILLFARTNQGTAGARGVSAFVLDADHVRITRDEEKLGINSSATNDLVVEDAFVAGDRLLHEENHGFRVAMTTLDGGRIGIGAQAVGIAQAAYDVASAYAKERQAFGRPIAEFQAIREKLADMATDIAAARLLVYRAACLREAGKPHTEAGAKAKLFASEMARRQTGEAIQILGGYGYTKEFPVERYYRDAKVTEIYEGTNEIQRLVIARACLESPVRTAR